MDFSFSTGQFTAGVFDSDVTFRGMTRTPPRTVGRFELEFFVEDGGVTYLDGAEIPIRAGMILCAKPGQERHSELPLRTWYLKITAPQGALCERLTALPAVVSGVDTARLCDRVRGVLAAKETGDDLLFAGLCLTLLSDVERAVRAQGLFAAAGAEKNRRAVSAAIAYMESHLGERCTLADIAAAAHFSPVYFHGLFRKAMGKTPQEYLTGLRVAMAKRLLFANGRDVGGVAEACGFSSRSYFDYVFRRETGETPRGYQKRMYDRYLQ